MLIGLESDQAAVSENPRGDYGKIVVTDTAAALGTTALPDPSSVDGDPEASWFVHQGLDCPFVFLSSVGFEGCSGAWYTIDSKSMRKVGPDDDIASIFSETGGLGALLHTRGRMLIQLH